MIQKNRFPPPFPTPPTIILHTHHIGMPGERCNVQKGPEQVVPDLRKRCGRGCVRMTQSLA